MYDKQNSTKITENHMGVQFVYIKSFNLENKSELEGGGGGLFTRTSVRGNTMYSIYIYMYKKYRTFTRSTVHVNR